MLEGVSKSSSSALRASIRFAIASSLLSLSSRDTVAFITGAAHRDLVYASAVYIWSVINQFTGKSSKIMLGLEFRADISSCLVNIEFLENANEEHLSLLSDWS